MQAGYQQALPALAGALARPCMMSGIGAWGDAATCLELLVVGDAIYRVALDSLEPPAWDADALDVDAIDRGRHRPHRLSRHAPHPPLAARQPRLRGPQLAPRVRRSGSPPAAPTRWSSRARAWPQALAREPVGLPEDVEAELCRLIDEAAARLGLTGHPDPRRLLEEARA